MRWGIVGTGAIASHFAVACHRSRDARCVAVAGRQADKAAQFAARFGIDHVTADIAALAARPDVDAVYVATPNTCHKAHALAAIAAAKPVLCEKPLAPTAADAREVIAAARTAGVFCMEGLWSLCQPAYLEAAEQVRAGAIGPLRELHASFCMPQSPRSMPGLFDPAGGGALLDRGVYLLALAQDFLGPLTLVSAHGTLSPDAVDLACTLVAENAEGARAVLSCAIDRAGSNTVTLMGGTGRIDFAEPLTSPPGYTLTRRDPDAGFAALRGLPGPAGRVKAALRRNSRVRLVKQALRGRVRQMPGGLAYQIAEVQACLAQGRTESLRVPLDLSLRTLELIDEARQRLAAQA